MFTHPTKRAVNSISHPNHHQSLIPLVLIWHIHQPPVAQAKTKALRIVFFPGEKQKEIEVLSIASNLSHAPQNSPALSIGLKRRFPNQINKGRPSKFLRFKIGTANIGTSDLPFEFTYQSIVSRIPLNISFCTHRWATQGFWRLCSMELKDFSGTHTAHTGENSIEPEALVAKEKARKFNNVRPRKLAYGFAPRRLNILRTTSSVLLCVGGLWCSTWPVQFILGLHQITHK